MEGHGGIIRGAVAVLISLLAGCTEPRGPQRIGDDDPASNIPAMQTAARRRDLKSASLLVKQLESDDPAVRLYAINALCRLTGQTFDYRYYDEEDQRKPAIQRWKQWLATRRK